MSTYSPSLRIELITTGDQAGTWGSTTNVNLGTLIENSIAGSVTVVATTPDYALTALYGAEDEARNAVLALTTTTLGAFNVYAPPAEKQYTVYNASLYAATLYNSTIIGNTTAAGLGVVIPAGKTVTVWSNGTDFQFQNSHLSSLTLNTDLAVADGGTGASTASAARVNLGLVIGLDVPSPTGTGASGTWNINVNGNAATAATVTTTVAAGATGTTQSFGTNNTTIATTAFVQAALQALHPVGSLYFNATNATNPASLLGFGTWVAFGAGRMPVGFDATNALFNTAEETGGSYDATLVSHSHTGTTGNQSNDHTHTYSGTTSTAGAHQHLTVWNGGGPGGVPQYTPTVYSNKYIKGYAGDGYETYVLHGTDNVADGGLTTSAGNHSHTFSGTTSGISAGHTHSFTTSTQGSSATNANLPPYITVYMWKRTA